MLAPFSTREKTMSRMQNKVLLIFVCTIAILLWRETSFSQSKDEAERLWELGEKAFAAQKHQEARTYYEQSLALCRQSNNREGIASNLNGLGEVYEALGDFRKALSYYEDAVSTARQINNKDLIATNLFNAASIYSSDLHQYEKAMQLFEESLRIFRELNNKESTAIVLFNTAKTLQSLGRYEQALSLFNESLRLNRELKSLPGIAGNLNLIGNVYARLGQYDKPLPLHEEALRINRQLADQKEIALTLRSIGDAYVDLLEYEKAFSYYEQALAIQKKQNLRADFSITLTNMGALYQALGRYDRALAAYRESLAVSRETDNRPEIATILNNIGHTYASLGKSDEALSYYQQALAIEKQLNRPQRAAIVYNNIGMEQFRSGQYEQALSHLQEALRISRQLNMVHDITLRLNNIGAVYLRQKKYREAEEAFLERKALQAKIPKIRLVHPGLEELYLIRKQYDAALALLEDPGRKPTWRSNSTYSLEYYTHYGAALKGRLRYREAAQALEQAVSLSEEMRLRAGEQKSFFAGGGYIGRLRPHRLLSAVLAERSMNGERFDAQFASYGKDLASGAFSVAELTRARTLLETMAAAARKQDNSELPFEIKNREKSLFTAWEEIEKRWEAEYQKGEAAVRHLQKEKENLKREIDSHISMVRTTYPRYAALNYPNPVPANELPLRDQEVLIEYALHEDGGYIFTVRKGGIQRITRISMSAEQLTERIGRFMEAVGAEQGRGFSMTLAKELYDVLLSPVAADVKAADTVVIVPDGILGLLPFEALVMETGKNYADSVYVGDRYAITYSQSASALALGRMRSPSGAVKPLFALGNPVFSKQDPRYIAYKQGKTQPTLASLAQGDYAYRAVTVVPKNDKASSSDGWEEIVFNPLPETEDEVRAIAGLYNVPPLPPDILLNMAATKSNVKRAPLKQYRYLHFATHADLPGKVQGIIEPFLILGQVENEGKDDGFLTLSNVLNLGLDSDMVVLSACMTGKGKIMEGEGVTSFARAFLHAGTRSVVVSLWEVASRQTVEYMEAFYGGLKAGRTKAEALKNARSVIKSKYPEPYFWSAFILHGER